MDLSLATFIAALLGVIISGVALSWNFFNYFDDRKFRVYIVSWSGNSFTIENQGKSIFKINCLIINDIEIANLRGQRELHSWDTNYIQSKENLNKDNITKIYAEIEDENRLIRKYKLELTSDLKRKKGISE